MVKGRKRLSPFWLELLEMNAYDFADAVHCWVQHGSPRINIHGIFLRTDHGVIRAMSNILDSDRIIDVSALGASVVAKIIGDRGDIGAHTMCLTREVWEQAIEPPGTDKRIVPNRLYTLCAFVVGHLEQFSTPGSLRRVLETTPFSIRLDSYDQDRGEYHAGGLENTTEFPYPAALKVELLVYHTLCRRPMSGNSRPLALLITMKGENVPEFPPLDPAEIQAILRKSTR